MLIRCITTMSYCGWADINERNEVYHDADCPCGRYINENNPTVMMGRDEEVFLVKTWSRK